METRQWGPEQRFCKLFVKARICGATLIKRNALLEKQVKYNKHGSHHFPLFLCL